MGLFDKKFCDICGNKIGLLGNRKLDDGNLCKDCAAKLSPWFSERRHSTVAQISEQLAYREANQAKVNAFNATRTIGRNHKLLIDDNKKQFLVSSGSNPLASNPDVLDFSQAMGCELSVEESKHEKKQTVNGNQVSYNPPKYEYSYTFRAVIRVSGNPYFDDMSFMISDGSVNTGETNMQATSGWTVHRTGIGMPNPGIDKYNEFMEIGNSMKAAIDDMRMGGNGGFTTSSMNGSYSAPGMGAMGTQGMGGSVGQAASFPIDSSTDPESQGGKYIYGNNPPVFIRVAGNFQYRIINFQLHAAAQNQMQARLPLALKHTLSKGIPGIAADALGMNGQAVLSAVIHDPANAGLAQNFGIEFTGLNLQVLEATSMMDVISKAQQEAMNTLGGGAPAGAPVGAVAGMAAGMGVSPAPVTAADGEWTCPACGAKNEGGKFCEFCGTPRA